MRRKVLSKTRKRRVERKIKMDDKIKFLFNKLNLKRKRKIKLWKKKQLQVELIIKSVLIIPRIYNLNCKN